MARLLRLAIVLLMVGFVPALSGGITTASADARDLCISVNGELKADTVDGGAICISGESDEGRPNIARAYDGAIAQSGTIEGSSGNTAIATGDGTWASAGRGDNNLAIAGGVGSVAIAGSGDNNVAIVSGDGAWARAAVGDDNLAVAIGDGANADILHGNNNVATATGNCSAVLTDVDNQTASCP